MHLRGSLACECEGKYRSYLDTFLHQLEVTFGEDRRLARTSTGSYDCILPDCDGGALVVVEHLSPARLCSFRHGLLDHVSLSTNRPNHTPIATAGFFSNTVVAAFETLRHFAQLEFGDVQEIGK